MRLVRFTWLNRSGVVNLHWSAMIFRVWFLTVTWFLLCDNASTCASTLKKNFEFFEDFKLHSSASEKFTRAYFPQIAHHIVNNFTQKIDFDNLIVIDSPSFSYKHASTQWRHAHVQSLAKTIETLTRFWWKKVAESEKLFNRQFQLLVYACRGWWEVRYHSADYADKISIKTTEINNRNISILWV
jgi:hypothetical protein